MMDKWQKPYIKDRTTKRFSHLKQGVYFIRDILTKKILYVGMSRYSIYKALYRHFSTWTDVSCRQVFDKNLVEVRVIICLDAHEYEKRLIRYFQPVSNKEMYIEPDPFWNEEKCPF
jgi:hypothetical protein